MRSLDWVICGGLGVGSILGVAGMMLYAPVGGCALCDCTMMFQGGRAALIGVGRDTHTGVGQGGMGVGPMGQIHGVAQWLTMWKERAG